MIRRKGKQTRPAAPAVQTDAFGFPHGTVWTPVRNSTPAPVPVRTGLGVEVGVLEAGERLDDIVIPPGHCGLGFRTSDRVFVYVEPRHQLIELLGEMARDLRAGTGWGSTS